MAAHIAAPHPGARAGPARRAEGARRRAGAGEGLTGPSAARAFTPAHRGGSGPPLVLIHGFTDTWRTWELVLPALERRHDVLAPTLPGHAGGPEPAGEITVDLLPDALERAMDEAGFATAHVAGNSLGGYLALRLAERGRARSVTALTPAGGWTEADRAWAHEMLGSFVTRRDGLRAAAAHADALVATPEGRRSATALVAERHEHIPAGLIAHQLVGAAGCPATVAMVELALRDGYPLDASRIECPMRIVWGTEDRLLPWPSAAARYRRLLPHADWVVLDGVGHSPQLDVPLETAELILGAAR